MPQGTVLGSLLFSLYINDIMVGNESEILLFADDCNCYRQTDSIEDTSKCYIMQLTRPRIKTRNAVYPLEGTVLETVDNIKYPGVTISKDFEMEYSFKQCLHNSKQNS